MRQQVGKNINQYHISAPPPTKTICQWASTKTSPDSMFHVKVQKEKQQFPVYNDFKVPALGGIIAFKMGSTSWVYVEFHSLTRH